MPADSLPDAILQPAQLNTLARDLLEGAFPSVWVEGEVGNLSRPASGHMYFNLKDARAQVRCAMFKPRSQWLRFRPADGMRVLVRGRLTLYEARGDYQLILEHMEEAGEGALLRALEALRQRLAAEGLFDAARKRPLPALPRRIGVLTSPTGAAVRDVLTVLGRRFPMARVDVIPIPVQGAEAAQRIVSMLRATYAAGRHDVLLLTRGGGSLEDLWSFNDEALVRAIAESPVPLVSAIGHETDTTLADHAADLRAATPSAAAELLVPDQRALLHSVDTARQRLDAAFRRLTDTLAQRADRAWLRLGAVRPGRQLARLGERLQALAHRLDGAGATGVTRREQVLARLGIRLLARHPGSLLIAGRDRNSRAAAALGRAMHQRLLASKQALAGSLRALQALSPLATLERGYALVIDPDGRARPRAADIQPGQALELRMHDGRLDVRVESVRPDATPRDSGP